MKHRARFLLPAGLGVFTHEGRAHLAPLTSPPRTYSSCGRHYWRAGAMLSRFPDDAPVCLSCVRTLLARAVA